MKRKKTGFGQQESNFLRSWESYKKKVSMRKEKNYIMDNPMNKREYREYYTSQTVKGKKGIAEEAARDTTAFTQRELKRINKRLEKYGIQQTIDWEKLPKKERDNQRQLLFEEVLIGLEGNYTEAEAVIYG